MATYTRADLRNAALVEIGVLDGQSTEGKPSPEDAKLADDRAQQELEYLYDEGYIPFDLDADDIPARYFTALVAIVAKALMLPFGTVSRAQVLNLNAQGAMKRLASLKNHRYMGTPVRTEYF